MFVSKGHFPIQKEPLGKALRAWIGSQMVSAKDIFDTLAPFGQRFENTSFRELLKGGPCSCPWRLKELPMQVHFLQNGMRIKDFWTSPSRRIGFLSGVDHSLRAIKFQTSRDQGGIPLRNLILYMRNDVYEPVLIF